MYVQEWQRGEKAFQEKGPAVALPFSQQAIELDPNFALAYSAAGGDYNAMGEQARASEYFSKAFHLRDHASEREELRIAGIYYDNVMGAIRESVADLPRIHRNVSTRR